jgi:hypothetical protein
MKKAAMFTLLAAFLIAGVMLNSCKKDTVQDVKTTTHNPVLKDAMGLNLMMGQYTDIGDVNIYVTYPTLYVDVVLDEIALDGYQVVEAHLWAAALGSRGSSSLSAIAIPKLLGYRYGTIPWQLVV